MVSGTAGGGGIQVVSPAGAGGESSKSMVGWARVVLWGGGVGGGGMYVNAILVIYLYRYISIRIKIRHLQDPNSPPPTPSYLSAGGRGALVFLPERLMVPEQDSGGRRSLLTAGGRSANSCSFSSQMSLFWWEVGGGGGLG